MKNLFFLLGFTFLIFNQQGFVHIRLVGLYMFLASWPPALCIIISLPISRGNYKKAMKNFNIYYETAPKVGIN